jgi:hypothetical protein
LTGTRSELTRGQLIWAISFAMECWPRLCTRRWTWSMGPWWTGAKGVTPDLIKAVGRRSGGLGWPVSGWRRGSGARLIWAAHLGVNGDRLRMAAVSPEGGGTRRLARRSRPNLSSRARFGARTGSTRTGERGELTQGLGELGPCVVRGPVDGRFLV